MNDIDCPLADTHCHLDLMPEETLSFLSSDALSGYPAPSSALPPSPSLLKAPETPARLIFVPGVTGAAVFRHANQSSRMSAGLPDNALPEQWRIYQMTGVHPGYLTDFNEQDFRSRTAVLRPFMIGEIGLDRRYEDRFSADFQEMCLRIQLAAARDYGIPVSLHVVGRHGAALRILREFPGLRGILHGFTGSKDLALEYLRSGFLLGIGPLILNPEARKLNSALAALAPENLVTETDAPFMSYYDNGIRKAATPEILPLIVRKISELQGRSFEDTAAVVFRNALSLIPQIPEA
ncbi:MAG: TatD family hydrolase [Succinimonas sp.]|nr:TatD family hydrolase [Succinimonas sp.]